MAKICKVITLLLLTTVLAGCTADGDTIHRKIHTRYYNMPSYSAKLSATVTSNKTKNTYPISVIYDSVGERYRIDYDNMSLILSATNARIKKDNTIMSLPVDNSYMLMLPNAFFKSYYTSESATYPTGSLTEGCTLLECDMLNPPTRANHMMLWIDTKTLTPRCMKIYDKEMNEKINIEYTEFKIINKIQDSVFEF